MAHEEQEARLAQKPRPSAPSDIVAVLAQQWHLQVHEESVKQIDSYDDANFYCESGAAGDRRRWLVKYYNAIEAEHPDLLHGLAEMLAAIRHKVPESHVEVPTILPVVASVSQESGLHSIRNGNVDMVLIRKCPVQGGGQCDVAVRVFKWIDGTTLSRCKASDVAFESVGHCIAAVHGALTGFDHHSFHRQHLWDLRQFHLSQPLLQQSAIQRMLDQSTRDCIANVISLYEEVVLPIAKVDQLPFAVIMGDCNDANIIVEPHLQRNSDSEEAEINVKRVVGLIDFSDAVFTWRVNEVAIAMAYALLTEYGQQPQHRHSAMGAVLAGYSRGLSATAKHLHLTEAELRCLPVLVAVRLCISVLVGAYAISEDPGNEYLKLHAVPGRQAICFLCKSFAAVDERSKAQEIKSGNSERNNEMLRIREVANVFEHHGKFFSEVYAAAATAEEVQYKEMLSKVYELL